MKATLMISQKMTVVRTLSRRADGRLWLTQGEEARPVVVRRCFPWTDPGRFISLRDDRNTELALIADPGDLDAESRLVLEEALVEAGFVLEVTGVTAIEEEVEIRHWSVTTRQGPRAFQTRLDDWPHALSGGGLLIRDVAGDLYHVTAPERLDARSRDLLWAYVD
jgi:hypothetical protein